MSGLGFAGVRFNGFGFGASGSGLAVLGLKFFSANPVAMVSEPETLQATRALTEEASGFEVQGL